MIDRSKSASMSDGNKIYELLQRMLRGFIPRLQAQGGFPSWWNNPWMNGDHVNLQFWHHLHFFITQPNSAIKSWVPGWTQTRTDTFSAMKLAHMIRNVSTNEPICQPTFGTPADHHSCATGMGQPHIPSKQKSWGILINYACLSHCSQWSTHLKKSLVQHYLRVSITNDG